MMRQPVPIIILESTHYYISILYSKTSASHNERPLRSFSLVTTSFGSMGH